MIHVEGYDRTHALSADEFHHMQVLVTRFQEGGKGWHKAARPALQRLLRPLEDVLDHLGAVNTIKRKYTIRTTVICLLIRAMVREKQSFWAFSTDIWFELLGTDYGSVAKFGCPREDGAERERSRSCQSSSGVILKARSSFGRCVGTAAMA